MTGGEWLHQAEVVAKKEAQGKEAKIPEQSWGDSYSHLDHLGARTDWTREHHSLATAWPILADYLGHDNPRIRLGLRFVTAMN